MTRNAIFKNVDNEVFDGFWNGKKFSFKPGEQKILPEFLADHFAKHLTNHRLLKTGNAKDESYTSPKKPLETARFMELYTQAFSLIGDRKEDEKKDALDAEIERLNSGMDAADEDDGEDVKVKEEEEPSAEQMHDDPSDEEEFEGEEETEPVPAPEPEEEKKSPKKKK